MHQHSTIEEAFENELASPDPRIRQLGQARKDAANLRKIANEAESLVEKARLDAELEAKMVAADIADFHLAKLMKQGPTRLDVWLQERIEFTMMPASCRGTKLL